jgi:hypothetical protein
VDFLIFILFDRWQDTGFGSHTYIRKLGKQRVRSAVASSAGSRPKTAPMSTKEKWKTDKPSDANQSLPIAATHGTKEIDAQTVDSMVRVYHICGSSAVSNFMTIWTKFSESTPHSTVVL